MKAETIINLLYSRFAKPADPPFTQWETYGVHMYREEGEICEVRFVNQRTGLRRTIVSSFGRICHFPGIEKGDWMEYLDTKKCLAPIVRFRTDFDVYDKEHYIMYWEIQPDGRYWEDESGFGSEDSIEIVLYALIDQRGHFTGPFKVYSVGIEKYL